jgi:hypothetical protein
MDEQERLRLEYDQTVQLLRSLTDTRFRLLAFIPTLSAAAVGLSSGGKPAVELLAIGIVGLAATVGILVYELRNSQIARAAAVRARHAEASLFPAGPIDVEPPEGMPRLFGMLAVWHGRGVALVYSAALAGWGYLVGWGFLRAVELGNARGWGLAIGAVGGALVFAEIERIERGAEGTSPYA